MKAKLSHEHAIAYKDVKALVHNARDPKEIVGIASLRASLRLAQSPSLIGPEVRRQIIENIAEPFRVHDRAAICGASFVPAEKLRSQIVKMLDPLKKVDRDNTRKIIQSIAEKVAAIEPATTGGGIASVQDRKIIDLIREPYDADVDQHLIVAEQCIEFIRPELSGPLVASLFARLAPSGDPSRSSLRDKTRKIGLLVERWGDHFEPDVESLFQIYKSFFRQSTESYLLWLWELEQQGHDFDRSPLPRLPDDQDSVAVTREIEWSVSRRGMRGILGELQDELVSNRAEDRWSAAQLIENATRYIPQTQAPRFKKTAGPADIVHFDIGSSEPLFEFESSGKDIGQRPPPSPGGPGEAEPNRYTDVTLYSGKLFIGDDSADFQKLADDEVLISGSPYTLEVAIRLKRTGIESHRAAPAVENPRDDKEVLNIYVLVSAENQGITFDEPFARISWPYNQDSDAAFFRFCPDPNHIGRKTIEVRLFDRSLDLLDVVRLVVRTVKPGSTIRTSLQSPRLTWASRGDKLYVDPKTPPRLASIDVGKDPTGHDYRVRFKFRKNNDEIVIPDSTRIAQQDIQYLLRDIRDFWTRLVITNFAASLTVTNTTFKEHLSQLRDLGVRAWRLLFGDRYRAQKGAREAVGELFLNEMLSHEGQIVQIAFDGITDFIFPWSILHPPISSDPVDPSNFWGARYQIEQVRDGPARDFLSDEPVEVVFAVDRYFGNAQSQSDMFDTFVKGANGKLAVTPPISQRDALFSRLVTQPPAHLYYFYCHGYAPTNSASLRPDGVKVLRELIEGVNDEPTRTALDKYLTLLSKMRNEAWIFIGDAEVTENQLRGQQFFGGRRPIVFLNMCQSADLMPSMTTGLVRLFLDRDAAAVIGTECPMTSVFANEFSKEVLGSLFAGDNVGNALWKARRKFLNEMRNPLGLAYTLYGRAIARLGASAPIFTK